MADHLAAEIQIGGKVRRRVAEVLCSVITAEHVSLDWGDVPFQPKTIEDLLAARFDNGDGCLTLRLYDDQARWGELEDLERFLQGHKIQFVRYTEGKYEYNAEVVAFHPACGLVQELTDCNRNPIVQAAALKPIADTLAKTLAEMRGGKADVAKLQGKLQRLHGKLCKCLPVDLPDLESFEIVKA